MTLAELLKIQAQDTGLATKTFTVSATPEVMARFERFLSYVQYCGMVGHSTDVRFNIDGDGADRFHVAEKLPSVSQEEGERMEVPCGR